MMKDFRKVLLSDRAGWPQRGTFMPPPRYQLCSYYEGKYLLEHPAQPGETPALDFAGRPLSEWQKLGYDQHSLVADPRFEDAAHDDYRLKADSPAWQLGFERIPVERIGRRGYDRRQYVEPGQ